MVGHCRRPFIAIEIGLIAQRLHLQVQPVIGMGERRVVRRAVDRDVRAHAGGEIRADVPLLVVLAHLRVQLRDVRQFGVRRAFGGAAHR
ncbi:hypothetical protein D9M72_651580 [compost metagenome]